MFVSTKMWHYFTLSVRRRRKGDGKREGGREENGGREKRGERMRERE